MHTFIASIDSLFSSCIATSDWYNPYTTQYIAVAWDNNGLGDELMAGLIIDNFFTNALISQIVHEGLLQSTSSNLPRLNPKRVELLLQSILLCGPALAFNLDKELSVSRRELEKLGICEIGDPYINALPIRTTQSPTEAEIIRAFQEVKYYKPFIVPYLYKGIKGYLEDDAALDKLFDLSYKKLGATKTRRLVEALPELALHFVFDWSDTDTSAFPEEAVTLIDGGSLLDETLIPMLLLIINEPKKLIAESHQRKLPILSTAVRSPVRSISRPKMEADTIVQVIQFALSESGYEMPRITTVSKLLELIEDDRVLSLRSVIKDLTKALERGQVDAIPKFQKQAQEATRSLQDISRFRQVLRWSFLLPLATGVAETFMGALPTASIAMSLGQTAADFALSQQEKKHEWIWLLPRKS